LPEFSQLRYLRVDFKSVLNKLKKSVSKSAVITIKHVSTFVNKVEIPCNFKEIFDLIDKCRYVFYGYEGRNVVKIYLGDSNPLLLIECFLKSEHFIKSSLKKKFQIQSFDYFVGFEPTSITFFSFYLLFLTLLFEWFS
jgi:hypothetical protein